MISIALPNFHYVCISVRPSTPFLADTDTPIFLLSTDTDTIPIRFKSGRGAAWLTDQRLQTPPPQLITAAVVWTGCSAAADAFDLLWTVKHSNYQKSLISKTVMTYMQINNPEFYIRPTLSHWAASLQVYHLSVLNSLSQLLIVSSLIKHNVPVMYFRHWVLNIWN